MNIEEYISSGILEGYLAGKVSEQEHEEVESMARIYPEVQGELEKLRDENPEILLTEKQEWNDSRDTTSGKVTSSLIFWRTLTIMLIVFILGTIVFYYIDRNRLAQEIAVLHIKNNDLEGALFTSRAIILQERSELRTIHNPDTEKIILSSTARDSNKYVVLYRNKINNKVWINATNLPIPAENKQYQLWTMQGSSAESLGVIGKSTGSLQEMEKVKNPDAFIITLEPFGGNRSPSMDRVILTSDEGGR